ncbi:hypothetical protein TCAL_01746 [Tigriopus californicus]|uniref:procollagen-proline 4-dioxygenase n=1 Tax=Tigriopus californicus TaxID=6832 RepID=A0A553PM73_TIGCA|nr:prolyl 4-hydroxylase subunit alpha-3-like [Tigriopus californicus]TRY78772.1 hypothetical protein TCAL_01746 [Tigriopus californicus]|eukprot:TCALIF_01746-PA protein Name:"Similar to P4HA2 Prolyl 4-hydroxylase subunit alpha-2 (Homo sapiens)" AED:0.04 eAED:0.04 QI:0/-1/0/1/-1/1/1/0/591
MRSVQVLCLVIFSVIFKPTNGQIKIEKKKEFITQDRDETELEKEIYTSTQQLEQFFLTEQRYVEDVKAIIDKKLVSVDAQGALGAYVASYEDIIGEQDEDETFMHNPLNVYNLIRHVAVGWGIIEDTLEKEKSTKGGNLPKRCKRVLARRKRDHVPGAADLDGVAVGIVRLHDYYKFNTTSFVEEGIFETDEWRAETNGDLTVWDAFKIGVKGTNQMLLGSGIDIMLNALEKAKADGMVTTPPFIEALDLKVLKNLIKTAKTVHDQKLDRWGPRTATHSTNSIPYDKRLAKKKKFASPKLSEVVLNNARIIDSGTEKEQYMNLCRGIDLRPEDVKSKLYCKYEHRNKPYYMYGPRKIEIVSLKPYIAVLHEFITPSESEEIISKSTPKLKRSQMVGQRLNGTLDDRRVSEQTWLTEKDANATMRLTHRIDTFLDLESGSTNHSELYQVANYGLAGQYDVHYDQVLMDKRHMQNREVFNMFAGDRMASLMGYLSDVAAGGHTVFPLVGAYIKPIKGAMVIWWNMDQAGGHDVLTRHGGCPVMIGSKWITNKWVRAHSQMFKRPCPKYTGRQIREFRNIDPMNKQRGGFFSDP